MTDKSGGKGTGGRKARLSATVADQIRSGIVAGSYPVGSRLPAEPEFASQLGVSRSTLREGLKLLEGDGLVVRRQRAGTTVTRRPVVEHPLQRNYGVSDLIESAGKAYAVRDAEIRFAPAEPEIAAALDIEVGAEVVSLERTRTADGEPVVRTVDYLDARIVEKATAPLLPDVSFYRWLHDHCGISVTYGVANLSAASADSGLARTLQLSEGDPLFVLTQVDFSSAGDPMVHSTEFHVPQAFDITIIRSGPFPG
jgi:GntR family transcriptional regulator